MSLKDIVYSSFEKIVDATSKDPNSSFPYIRMVAGMALCAGIVFGLAKGIEYSVDKLGNMIYSTENKIIDESNNHINTNRISLDNYFVNKK